MQQYKHSEGFAKLKRIKESITDNLTSYQYLSVLDDLLYKALAPIVESTRFMDVFLAQMLGWQTTNPKRKTCSVGRHAFSSYTTLFLLSDSPKQKMKILKTMRLDRSMLFEVLRRWFALADEIRVLGEQTANESNLSKLYSLQDKCGIKSGYTLTATYQVSHYWYLQAVEFKRKILEKYTRLCLTTAKRDYEDLEHKVPLDDIVQVYLLTAAKAIDKCDSERGVLTTHIQNWLLSAKNVVVSTHLANSNNEVSVSSTTNKIIVDDLVEGYGLEEMSINDDHAREHQAAIEEIRLVAKAFDPSGVGRILLHIQETLSNEDIQVLRAMSLKEEDKSDPVCR